MASITEKNLLKYGFEKREYGTNVFFAKNEFAVVQNVQWLPYNFETGVPLNTLIYVDTIEELKN